MNSKFYYRLYGINIESPMEFNELIKSEKTDEDIMISYGNVPADVLYLMDKGCNGYCTEKIMWFNIENVGIYYVYEGKNIVIQVDKNANIDDIKAYLLGTALGMILIQKNIIAIHGGTVLIGGKAITIVGDAGAGKSTLISGLRINGYPFMADDVSVLSDNMVNFSYPQQKLCKDVMKQFQYELDNYRIIDSDREKYVVPIKDNFVMKPMELRAIFEISVCNDEEVTIKEVKGNEKLQIMIKNIYRSEIIKIIGFNSEYFKKCLRLISNVHLYKIQRPNNKFSIENQIKLIEDTMKAI